MANFRLTQKAVADLSDIWNYTFDTWSEQQADKYYMLLLEAFQELAERPQIGKAYDEVFPNLLGYKAYKHLIFYTADNEGIEIVRVLHSRMDLRKQLSD